MEIPSRSLKLDDFKLQQATYDLFLRKPQLLKQISASISMHRLIAFILAAERTLKSLVSTKKKKRKSSCKQKGEENVSGL